ncbi:MAG: carboxylating nicotinate-nucleotide diphosphorylase [bacterium]
MFNNINIDLNLAIPLVKLALLEDLSTGDITTDSIITNDRTASFLLHAKQNGIIAGLPILKIVFEQFNRPVDYNYFLNDGDFVLAGQNIIEIHAPLSTLLKAERTALNFLQRMSGIATKTNEYVKILEPYATKILDTRKTLPGFRLLDKYSVRIGGGCNHRFGLFDMVMIKDNHIKAAGSITEAVKRVKTVLGNKFKIEVETTSLIEVEEALKSNADIIMLDNMDNNLMQEAVYLINGKAITEASGSITIERLKNIGQIGVNYISVGALTHSVNALDISANII